MSIVGGAAPYLAASPGIGPYPKMSIAAWIKIPATATATNYFFKVTAPPAYSQFNLHFAGVPTPNVFGAVAQALSGSIDGTGVGLLANLSGWHFVLATFDDGGVAGGVQSVAIYIDGAFNNQVSGPITGLVQNDALSADYIWSGDVDGGGIVDYPMIWKRLVTPSEVAALWAQGDPRVVAPAQLVSFAQLNLGSGSIRDLVNPAMNWVVTNGTFTVQPPPFQLNKMKRYPAPMKNPPKLRSFVDHWPHATDMFRNQPLAAAYIDHFPQAGDLLPDVKDEPQSYVDHFAKPGDLVKQ